MPATKRYVIDFNSSGVPLLTTEHTDGTWKQIRADALPGLCAQLDALRDAQIARESAESTAAKVIADAQAAADAAAAQAVADAAAQPTAQDSPAP